MYTLSKRHINYTDVEIKYKPNTRTLLMHLEQLFVAVFVIVVVVLVVIVVIFNYDDSGGSQCMVLHRG